MVFLNNSCKFNDKNKIGGNKCINGKWSKNECQVSHCNYPYTFNTYNKECLLNKKIKMDIQDYNKHKSLKKQWKREYEEYSKKKKNFPE